MAGLKINRNLQSEINKTIKNFNQKIKRLEKLDTYNLLHIPKTQSKKDLLNSVSNKRELRNKLNELKRFSKRGAEKTVTTKNGEEFSAWELENYKKARQKALNYYNKKIKQLEADNIKVAGKKMNITFAQMGDPTYISAIRNKEKIMREKTPTKENYKENIKYFNRQKSYQNAVLKENYLRGLLNLGYQSGVPNSVVKNVHDNFMKLNDKDFLNLYNNDLAVSKMMNYYRVHSKNLSSGSLLDDEIYSDVYDLFIELNNNLEEILQ